MAPKADASVSRFYREGTLILVTQFMLSEGLVELIDFMPLGSEVPQLIRIIRGLSGRVMMISNLALRFEYGSALPWVEALDDGSIRAICGPEMAVLYPSVPHRGVSITSQSMRLISMRRSSSIPKGWATRCASNFPCLAELTVRSSSTWATTATSKCSARAPPCGQRAGGGVRVRNQPKGLCWNL